MGNPMSAHNGNGSSTNLASSGFLSSSPTGSTHSGSGGPKPLYLCQPFVKAALVKGSFKTIVAPPKYVDVNEWVAVNCEFRYLLALWCSFELGSPLGRGERMGASDASGVERLEPLRLLRPSPPRFGFGRYCSQSTNALSCLSGAAACGNSRVCRSDRTHPIQ